MTSSAIRRFLTSRACWLGAMALLIVSFPANAADQTNSPLLTVQRIFDSGEFSGAGFSARWLEDSSGYTTFQSSKDPSGSRDLVRHDPKTGAKEAMARMARMACQRVRSMFSLRRRRGETGSG